MVPCCALIVALGLSILDSAYGQIGIANPNLNNAKTATTPLPSNAPPYEWDRNEFPNPQIDVKKCGRAGRKSYVCDPNRILTFREANDLDHVISGIVNETACPCLPYRCSRIPLGFRISLAIVPKIKRVENASESTDAILYDAKVFAYTLESRLWNFGQCDEDVVIFYSRDDNVLYTMTGSIAKQKLMNQYVTDITMDVRQHFNRNLAKGFKRMIMDYGDVFLGVYPRRTTPAPKVGRKTSNNGGASAGAATTSFIAMATIVTHFLYR